jgi:hypothetical protein
VRTLYLVEERPCPTTDYFLEPVIERARSNPSTQVLRAGFDEVPHPSVLADAEILFVRYLPPAWVRALCRDAAEPRRLVLFIDDDLLDPGAWSGTPWRYRWKLYWLSARHRRWLQRRVACGKAELWVGSEALQHKYAHLKPTLIRPCPPRDAIATPVPQRPISSPRPASSPRIAPAIRLFYHGSASHQLEHAWLQDLLRELLATDRRLSVEVITDRRLAKGYRGLPRARIVPPMDWPSYRAFLQQPGRRIGLVPMLPTAFNAARTYTKFFEITAAGAVGLYTRGSVYEHICTDQEDGLLLPLDAEAWQTAIRALADDGQRRERMLARARERLRLEREAIRR